MLHKELLESLAIAGLNLVSRLNSLNPDLLKTLLEKRMIWSVNDIDLLFNKVSKLTLTSDDGEVFLVPKVVRTVNEYLGNDNQSRLNLSSHVEQPKIENACSAERSIGS